MTAGSPVKLMLTFALPLMAGNVCQQLYTVTDTAIVGRGVGIDALAALGCSDWLGFLLFATAQGFTQGFSIRMSQEYGAGNKEGLKRTVGTSAILSIFLAVVCTILGLWLLPFFLRVLNVPENLYDMACLYMAILFGGVGTALFNNFCASTLRAVGNSRTPFIAMIISSATNIVLDSLTVFIFKWGIAGAAGATVFSQLVAGLICFIKIRQTPELCINRSHLVHNLEAEKHLMALGLPVSLQNIGISIGGILVLRIVNTFGTGFIAGYTASGKLYGILEIAAISYSYAVTTYVGQNFGAGLKTRLKKGMRQAIAMGILTAVLVGGLMFIFGRQAISLFISTDDALIAIEAEKAALTYIHYMAAFLPVLYMIYIVRSALQGVGKPGIGMVSAGCELLIRIACANIASATGNRDFVFLAEISAWFGGAAVVVIAWVMFIRKYMKENA